MKQRDSYHTQKRHQYMVDFLMQFFEEENAPAWQAYLTKFLKR